MSPVTATQITDFTDRLSPMVVKELRQGLRTRSFTWLLMLLHLGFILVTLLHSAGDDPSAHKAWLYGLSGLFLCCFLPLSGFSSIASEIEKRTLDMLVLTRLSAVRIVVGKWFSIALQSGLIALSLTPYYVINTAITGSNITDDLLLLGWLWVVSVVAASAVICISSQKQVSLRVILTLFIIINLMSRGVSRMWQIFMVGLDQSGTLLSWLILILLSFWLIFIFLGIAATRIAPLGVGYACVKRLVNFVFLALVLGIHHATGSMAHLTSFVVWIIILATVDALVERENTVPSPLVPFYRKGLLGRLASYFLSPGWPSGFLYSLLLTSMTAVSSLILNESNALLPNIWFSEVDLWLCMVLVLFLGRRWKHDLLTPFIFVYMVMSIISSIGLSFTIELVPKGGEILWMAALNPSMVTHYMTFVGNAGYMMQYILLGYIVSFVWCFILGTMAFRAIRRERSVRAEAARMAALNS